LTSECENKLVNLKSFVETHFPWSLAHIWRQQVT